jgi:hypothetical protein
VATTLAVLALAMEVAAVVLYVANSAKAALTSVGFNGVAILIVSVTFPIVGWLIASRRRENRFGWIFLAVGFFYALTLFSGSYAAYGLVADPGSLPLADVMAWLTILSWVPALTLLILLLLFFPDGRLPSRRWWPVVLVASVALVVMVVPDAIAFWPYRGPLLMVQDVPTPASDPAPATAGLLLGVGLILNLVVAIAGTGALVVRFRRSVGTEHQQIKWFASAAVAEVAAIFVTTWVVLPPPFDALVAIVVAPLIPIAVGVAILRYRLYDIDRIISRTVSYGLITALLVMLFLVVNLGLQGLLSSVTSGNSLAVAGSTLLAAGLFTPVRRRVQRIVDRRFDRARYDGERTASAFSVRMRDATDLPTVTYDLDATVRRAIAPSSVGLWLRGDGR